MARPHERIALVHLVLEALWHFMKIHLLVDHLDVLLMQWDTNPQHTLGASVRLGASVSLSYWRFDRLPFTHLEVHEMHIGHLQLVIHRREEESNQCCAHEHECRSEDECPRRGLSRVHAAKCGCMDWFEEDIERSCEPESGVRTFPMARPSLPQ
eukprot:30034-Prymnesium_polylepis.1